jgi:anti-sigma factor RsiW
MTDRWTESLSDYLDGDLTAAEARTLESHLEACEECSLVLGQLRRVKNEARALADPLVPDDLWAGIASRIGPAASASVRPPVAASVSSAAPARVLHLPARRPAFAWGWAMAAGIALLLVSAAALVLSTRSANRAADPTLAAGETTPGGSADLATFDAAQVEGEIAELQAALDKGRGKLDPKTVEILEKNLTLIRQATEDAKRALAADPANQDLQDYFASTVQKKLDLMRRATSRVGA